MTRCASALLACALLLATHGAANAAAKTKKKKSAKAAQAKSGLELKIEQWTMKNGLRVVYLHHDRVPAVTVQVWYHVGSKDEHLGTRGVAHMFEHLMFKGSKRVKPEAHARMISAVGGSVNAFTTQDLTAYHNTLPKQYLDFAVKLEAERMRHLLLIDKHIDSEREVVKEEKRKRLENSPIGRSLEAIYEMAYKKHPYQWTPAGKLRDLNAAKRAFYTRFYNTYYVPNNATLVVVGDVSKAQVKAAADKHFGPIPAGKKPPRVTVREGAQTKLRERTANWPSQLAVVLGAYHIPGANSPDMAPLQVLSAILSAGRSSRLHQDVVRKRKLALQAGGFARPQEHPGLMMIYAVGLPSHDVSKMKDALLAEVERVAKSTITKAELKKAKNQLATSRLMSLRTIWGIAYQIGSSAYLKGNPTAFLDEVAKIDRVSAADVKRVAKKYLTRENLSILLLPPGQGGGK
ncbi:MAG: insulinase family protein [Myxococcales bacterium]|nr:insulinase family protein [Myxococcales bacterium]